jgi:basic membrane lipoprotein Med (substrate-binding protein (PBP1-ABC) superfamily)/DNA-binding SARP family transcriptional activator
MPALGSPLDGRRRTPVRSATRETSRDDAPGAPLEQVTAPWTTRSSVRSRWSPTVAPWSSGPPKQRTVLAVLLLHANQPVTTDRLVELVWGDVAPRTAAHSVQVYVSDLRRRFTAAGAPQAIATRGSGYVLNANDEAIDAQRFERLVVTGSRLARAGDADGGAQALEAALRLWRGPPLAEFAYAEFAQPHIRRLDELRLRAVEEVSAARLQLGHAADALGELSTLLEQHPLRERARELQLLSLYRSGRQADALRSYDAYRRQLADELGVDPSPALQQLQGRILLQDATLLPFQAASNGGMPVRNPFKGLRAFTEADAADFFGRRKLVDELCAVLAGGARLVVLVGPSGSGKSSLAAAGLLPALRSGAVAGSDRWRIGSMVPGAEPASEWQVALASASRRPSPSAPVEEPAAPGDAPVAATTLVLIDQFEELFTLADGDEAAGFLTLITDTLREGAGRVRVVVTLRGDFYDRPLLHPAFAELFTGNVVDVLPLDLTALEAAVTEPARRVGVDVDPALVAELLTDAVGQPGALPLFQYALTELFDHRDGGAITLRCYRELGGLHGALSRRAEGTYAELVPRQQELAKQVFLRLVSPGHGTADVRRRVTATELQGLDLDPVELADVLERFGRHRLLTFDRDPTTGDATVEVAHEALLDAWSRLRGWIEEHRTDLRRLERLAAAVADWGASGGDDDYLLTGGRLGEYLDWRERTSLHLTRDAVAYLDASRRQRDAEVAQDASRRAHEAGLHRRARRRLWALFATAMLLAAVTTAFAFAVWGNPPPDVAIITDESTPVIGELVVAGAEQAADELGLRLETIGPVNDVTVTNAADRGVPLIFYHAGTSVDHPSRYPDLHFVLMDFTGPHEPRDNLTYLDYAEHEGSFLVGAAAALTSQTGRVGFIGGMENPVIWRFLAGFEAGARHIDPGIEVDIRYLTRWPDNSGWGSPTLGAQAATELYQNGADVVYHAAGASGWGLFEAVVAESRRQARHLWAIGVDGDEYLDDEPERLWEYGPEDWRPHILTSMIKRFDTSVYTTIIDHERGALEPGERLFDLANEGVDYATSGGFLDEHVPLLEQLRSDIIAGRIVVPTVPESRSDA